MEEVYVYMLHCADGSYYVGTARCGLERRVAEHNAGSYGGHTARRRPVTLVWWQSFQRIDQAIEVERRLKGWSRAKKEALIAEDWATIQALSRRRAGRPRAR